MHVRIAFSTVGHTGIAPYKGVVFPAVHAPRPELGGEPQEIHTQTRVLSGRPLRTYPWTSHSESRIPRCAVFKPLPIFSQRVQSGRPLARRC